MGIDCKRKRAAADRPTEPLSALVTDGALFERGKGDGEPEREGDHAAADRRRDEAAARGPTEKTGDKAERQRRRSAEQEGECPLKRRRRRGGEPRLDEGKQSGGYQSGSTLASR